MCWRFLANPKTSVRIATKRQYASANAVYASASYATHLLQSGRKRAQLALLVEHEPALNGIWCVRMPVAKHRQRTAHEVGQRTGRTGADDVHDEDGEEEEGEEEEREEGRAERDEDRAASGV